MDTEQDVVNWILEPLIVSDRENFGQIIEKADDHHKSINKSFDCSIMDVADDIAYGVHDLEDAIALGLISEPAFRRLVPTEKCTTFLDALKAKYPGESANNVYDHLVTSLFGNGGIRKRFIGRLVHHFLTNVVIETMEDFSEPLLRYRATLRADQRQFLTSLQALVRTEVIESPSVQHRTPPAEAACRVWNVSERIVSI